MISDHITEFQGDAVVEWDPEAGLPANPAGKMVRIACEYDDEQDWPEKLATLLADPRAGEVTGIVVGPWVEVGSGNNSAPVVEALAAARDRLPNLRSIFFGDITSEESEVSWIAQSDLSPLFNAYPRLVHFAVRGTEGLTLGRPSLPQLKTLIVQTGGLPAGVVHEVCAADLPALEHLELWLGTSGYGGEVAVDDLAVILRGERFPKLRYLGLRNSEIADEVATVLASAPILSRLAVLDLSMGTLSDAGATALLGSPATRTLRKLDIHHHYCSEETVAALATLGIDEIDASEREDDPGPEDRYVEVSE